MIIINYTYIKIIINFDKIKYLMSSSLTNRAQESYQDYAFIVLKIGKYECIYL